MLSGVPVSGDTPLQDYADFFGNVIGGLDPVTVAIGLVSLAALMIGARWLPRFPMLLVVTVAAIAVSAWFDLADHGVALVGEIPAGLPTLGWPDVSLAEVLGLAPSAVGIALVGFSDAILTARSLASPQDRRVDADQEMAALAGLNLFAGLSQSFPLGSSGSRSAVNVRLGGRSQIVGLVQAGTVVAVLLFLTGALALLPKATLAAVIIYAAFGLIDVRSWRSLARGAKGELVVALATVVGMLTVGLLPALVLAVLLSVLDVVRRSAQPRDAVLGWDPARRRFVDLDRHPEARRVPGVVAYRLDDRLFFANSRYFAARVHDAVVEAPDPVATLVFDAEAVTSLDTAAAQALRKLIEDLAAEGIAFILARPRRLFTEQAARLGLDDVLPADQSFATVRAAVRAVAGVDLDDAGTAASG